MRLYSLNVDGKIQEKKIADTSSGMLLPFIGALTMFSLGAVIYKRNRRGATSNEREVVVAEEGSSAEELLPNEGGRPE